MSVAWNGALQPCFEPYCLFSKNEISTRLILAKKGLKKAEITDFLAYVLVIFHTTKGRVQIPQNNEGFS